MAGMTVLGTGSYKPHNVLTNQMLEQIIDTNDEWIVSRTGIRGRAMAQADETSLSMAMNAAQKAIEQSGISIDQIGVVIAATLSGDYITPSLACLLQRDLKLDTHVLAMDVNCACSGFIFAMKTAHALLADQPNKVALVVGCEMLSRIIDYTDRSTCIIFGDGAGAAIIKRTETGTFLFDGGSRGDDQLLVCKAQYLGNSPFVDRAADRAQDGLHMNGQEVFRFALETATKSVKTMLGDHGIALEDVDHFVLHQANKRILDGVGRRLGIPPEKCVVNIEDTGNTSAASVAIALDECNRSGKLKPGDKLVMTAFGGGLTYASVYFVW